MKRIAFSIVYDAHHHLKHNDQANRILQMFDLWIVVEGAAGTGGSTSWCKEFFRSETSTDGTREYLKDLQTKNPEKMIVDLPDHAWKSKDDMCRRVIDLLKMTGIEECFLWEIDADEQWQEESLKRAEEKLIAAEGKVGMFLCDCYVAQNLIAVGDWGEGKALPYRRLFLWNGEQFHVHEPPTLEGGNIKEVLIDERFDHYSYYFEKDVHFKSVYYNNNEDFYSQWIKLQLEGETKKIDFPVPVSYLFGRNNWIGRSNTFIIKK